MSQTEQKRLFFDIDAETTYIDLASALTAANRKQYHQVAANGNPLCYHITVTSSKGSTIVKHASNAFIIGNAVKQTCLGWKAQLRHAGIKLKDLPAYGRRARFALETNSYAKNTLGISGEVLYEIDSQSQPRMSPGGGLCFTTYTSTDDKTVSYEAPSVAGAGKISANQITQVTVTDGAGTESNEPLVLLGTSNTEFNVVREYLRARRGTPDVSIDTPGPQQGAAMLNLFSVAEEISDDIVDGVEEYMDWKPYTPDHETNTFDDLVQGTNTTSTVAAAEANYPPLMMSTEAPLGLLRVDSANGNQITIDVHAIYEM